jgi:hypothetical protein
MAGFPPLHIVRQSVDCGEHVVWHFTSELKSACSNSIDWVVNTPNIDISDVRDFVSHSGCDTFDEGATA